jgi:signal transduction histidine kinase
MRNRYENRLQKLKYQQALLDERNRISQDMHDEIGANLSEIVIFSQHNILKNNQPKSFEKIAIRAREVLDSISEIIWATNPSNDKLDTLLAYMREQASSMLETTNIKTRIDFPYETTKIIVSAENRRNIYLIMKESIINIIKHAQAQEVIIKVSLTDTLLTLLIQDNGNGQLKIRKGGMGLKNLQKRADSLSAKIKIDSLKGIGSSIELSLDVKNLEGSNI